MEILENCLNGYAEAFFRFYPEIEKYKENISFIYAGASNGFSLDSINLKRDIIFNVKKGKKKFVFLNIDETVFSKDIDLIHNVATPLKIKFKDIFYVTTGLNASEEYEKYALFKNYKDRINIITVSAFETCINSKHNIEYRIENKEKLFLCFNRQPRFHRIELLAKILKNNLLEKSFYSFLNTINDGEILMATKEKNEDFNLLTQNKNILPLILNRSAEINPINIETDDLYYFQNSYFSLVTETLFYNGIDDRTQSTNMNTIFFSEKIFKPITAKHPFILVGQPHSLKWLKKMGYKTFHPIFNELYDNIENDEERMNAIEKELVRLSRFNNEKWLTLMKFLKPIVEYNYNLYYKRFTMPMSKFRISDNIEHLFAN
jgi:hypothetical protein